MTMDGVLWSWVGGMVHGGRGLPGGAEGESRSRMKGSLQARINLTIN